MDATTLPQRLEHGEIVSFAMCPFPLPNDDDRKFLFQQRQAGLAHKHICFDLESREVAGFAWQSAEQAERLQAILERFANAAASWVADVLPRYARSWQRDRVTFRAEEEATRKVQQISRGDLLHIDAFPGRPTGGQRILRLFVNIHPTEPRVWAVSQSLSELLARFGNRLHEAGVEQWTRRLRNSILNLFRPSGTQPSDYDEFMLRLHDFLKSNDDFQEQALRKFHHFAPGTAWLAFTDSLCHAETRGQFALEHSFFISLADLAIPGLAPCNLWRQYPASLPDARAA